ncbi:DnaJ domain-containing protein [Scheffersomyces coipomensis]|uniref:DnaJ domain-containing protein n=1 Tax=Scheffersomyces coipomensis TaxID=1788519 RepID=UPI00315DA944
MAVPFPDIDPYEILEVAKDSSPIDIKKSYKKLCLKYHPDKLQQQQQTVDPHQFPKIQFAYSILSDSNKRQRYDRTGSLHDFDDDEGGDFNWQEYFDSINEKITIEMIVEDKLKYQNSEEEKDDIITNFIYYEGDFLKLFELIPHLEFSESEEQRVFAIIEDEIESNEDLQLDKSTVLSWNKYKKSRKTKVKQMLKKLAKEAKEAEELEQILKSKSKSHRSIKNESDLSALIKSRQSNRLDTLINSLESKYINNDKKGGKKRASKDISDAEFDRIQKDLTKNKRSKN